MIFLYLCEIGCIFCSFISSFVYLGSLSFVLGEPRLKPDPQVLKPDPQGFCFSTLRPDPTANRAVAATEHRRSPSSHLALTLATPSAVSPPTKVIPASTSICRNWQKYFDSGKYSKDLTLCRFKCFLPRRNVQMCKYRHLLLYC